MNDKRRNILILVVVAALVAVSLYYIYPPGKKTHLGLDLQGGLEVVFKATVSGNTPSSDQMSQAISIMDERVNGLGVTEATIQQQGPDEIAVSLPGEKNVADAMTRIGQTAQLRFYVDYKTRVAGPVSSVAEAVKQARTAALVPVPAADKKELAKLAAGGTSDKYVVVTAPPSVTGGSQTAYYIYKSRLAVPPNADIGPAMTGAAIKSARQAYDQFGKPDVEMDFTGPGQTQFEAVTKDLALHGLLKQQNQAFAIVLDNQMYSDPVVDYKDNPNGISGNSAIITGSFTVAEAKSLAVVINYGSLPVDLKSIQSRTVSATLGKDSLRQALNAGLVGLALILIYLLAYYRFLGIVADLALIIYGILLWGLFNAIPVTLTLPGIAGMILTIGVAADANVVIFERIKEEVRHGRTVRSAINSGYSRGFRTILDANVLTLLTAVVLFEFATAQPKGFAFTLILGVLVSMFTAVLATRALLGLLSDFAFFNKAEFMGVHARDIVADEPEPRGGGARRRQQRRVSTARKKS